MKHQKIVSRFLSSNTPYNGLLFFHEMGTGKSCAAIATTELLLEDPKYRKVLYLAPSENLIDNFQTELISKCTDNKYDKKSIKKYYNFGTFEKFSTKVKKNSIKFENYSNYVIVLDEVHNVSTTTNNYEYIHSFLHKVKECIVILLTGTPMVNSSKDLLSIMNLILPINKQIDTDSRRVENQEDIKYFKEIFKGRISYLKAKSDSNIERHFMGEKPKDFKEFKLSLCNMSDFQNKVYERILKKSNKNSNFNLDEIQSSLFVYPDGSYGSKGFKKYITTNNKGKIMKRQNTVPRWKFASGKNKEFSKENLYKFSCKYAQTMKIIKKAKEQGKIVFVFNNSVEQSGIILFSLLLSKLYNYSRFTNIDKKGELTDKERYILLTGNSGRKEIKALLNKVNDPNNKSGNKIRVILGSNIVSEGFTFKNVQIVVIQTPHWNYSKLTQAIARSYRAGSHKDLQDLKDLKIEIYQQAAISKNQKDSIDLKMYKHSENKDIDIKKMERIVKESAFDCALNYERNRSTGLINNSRDCEYSDCNYFCDDILSNNFGKPEPPKTIDYGTYNLYYSDTETLLTQKKIQQLYRDKFKLSYEEIKISIGNKNNFILLNALQNLINKNLEIYSKWGEKCYLREDKNIYYLVDNFFNTNNYLSSYYVKFPYVINSNIEGDIKKLISQNTIQIKSLCESIDENTIIQKFYSLDRLVANFLLQQAYLANIKNIQKNIKFRDILINITKDYVVKKVNFFLWSEKNDSKVEVLKDKDWVEPTQRQYEDAIFSLTDKFEKLETNEYKLYALLEYKGDKTIFKIKTLDNKKNLGLNIKSINVSDLAMICAVNLKLAPPKEFFKFVKSRGEFVDILKSIKKPSEKAQKLRYLYWNSKKLISKKIPGASKFKITVNVIIPQIKKFLYKKKIDGVSMVQNQHMFNIYKFYSQK